jgi:laminin alpha 1/2
MAHFMNRNFYQKWLLGVLFLIPEEKFHVGSQLELQLEFRTSENTGVILSVSEPNGYPALSLEINDGKVS